jgi:hypothetical protein
MRAIVAITVILCLVAAAWWLTPRKSEVNAFELDYEIFRIAGRDYRWPKGFDSAVLPESVTGVGTHAILPTAVWVAILRAALPGEEIRAPMFAPTIAIFRRTINQATWQVPLESNRPPVESQINAERKSGGIHYWKETRSASNTRYMTFEISDYVFARCGPVDDKFNPCYAYWNDNGVIHGFSVRPEHIERLPEIAKWYGRVVTPR